MNDIELFRAKPVIFLVDDDSSVLKALSRSIEHYNLKVKAYSTARMFLENYNDEHGCLVLDLSMPDMGGLELQAELVRLDFRIPIVFISGYGRVSECVNALRNGAVDFIEKPFRTERLLGSIQEAIELDWNIRQRMHKNRQRMHKENELLVRITNLTERERDIFDLLVEAEVTPSSKEIARNLKISHRTVEHHRSRILEKLAVQTVVELRLTVSTSLKS